ncbi:MAG TPA: response regulator transcription factor [Gemmatimonadaceae bacterium]|nr:response regulator transcription factor [Gemmatimonadaceae bacterium]
MARVLIVEDSAELAAAIKHNLEFEGYEVLVAADGVSGIDAVRSFAPDLIILDVMLPGADGFQVLRTIRQDGVVTPVMMLTALGEEADQVRAFRLDADQYVTKPFRLVELLERIAMMLRRSAVTGAPAGKPAGDVLRFGDVSADPASRKVTKAGVEISVTPRALDLLFALAARPGVVFTRQDLLRLVWKHQADVVTRTVDSHISELRQKLEDRPDEPKHIVTVWKAGYRFEK